MRPKKDDIIAVRGTGIDWRKLGLDPRVIVENSARVKGRWEPEQGPSRPGKAAIVAFGPSLNDTWPKLRDFDGPIFTCSGAHKFLLDRGIVPTYHVESDPQRHKPAMLGTPHANIIYLIASICHPTYFDLLEAHNAKVLLWHLLFTDKEVQRYLPDGEWLLTGGNTVGVRTMKIAYLMRWRKQEIFGLDLSGTHADAHGKPPTRYREFEWAGKTYRITENNIYHFYGLFADLASYMPDLDYIFHGDGLVQAAVAKFKRQDMPKEYNAVMKKGEI